MAWRRKIRDLSGRGKASVVFVPTMGALHDGHVALIRRARRLAGPRGFVVVSIFVNPTQFGPKEDLSRYPRPFAEDRALCRREGVDLLFHPTADEMYAKEASVKVSEGILSKGLCGASRPGHFDGVCTVVTMLFQILQPDVAVFGEKDWQQLAVIRRMVRDLKIPVKIVGHPTVREEDGLALSSRNLHLSPEERRVAPLIHRALWSAATRAEEGETSVARLERGLKADLSAIPGAAPDYAVIVDESTLAPIRSLTTKTRARALVAVGIGRVRLIDNLRIAR